MANSRETTALSTGKLSELSRLRKRWSKGDSIPPEILAAAADGLTEVVAAAADWKARRLIEARFLAFLVVSYPASAWPAQIAQRLIPFLDRDGASEAEAVTACALTSMFQLNPRLPEELLRWHLQDPGKVAFSRELLFAATSVRESNPALFLACVKGAALTPSPCSLSGVLATGHVDAGPEFDERTINFLDTCVDELSDTSWLRAADPTAVINLVGDTLKISGLGLLQRNRFGFVLDWALRCSRWNATATGTAAMLCAPLAYWASEIDQIAPWMESEYRRVFAAVRTDPVQSSLSSSVLDAIETRAFRQLAPVGGGAIRANAFRRVGSHGK